MRPGGGPPSLATAARTPPTKATPSTGGLLTTFLPAPTSYFIAQGERGTLRERGRRGKGRPSASASTADLTSSNAHPPSANRTRPSSASTAAGGVEVGEASQEVTRAIVAGSAALSGGAEKVAAAQTPGRVGEGRGGADAGAGRALLHRALRRAAPDGKNWGCAHPVSAFWDSTTRTRQSAVSGRAAEGVRERHWWLSWSGLSSAKKARKQK